MVSLHGEGWNTDPVFDLTHGISLAVPEPSRPGEPTRADYEAAAVHSRGRLGAFSPRERAALAEYLRHRRALGGDGTDRTSDRAIERFWERPE